MPLNNDDCYSIEEHREHVSYAIGCFYCSTEFKMSITLDPGAYQAWLSSPDKEKYLVTFHGDE